MIDFNIRDYVREALPDGRYTFEIVEPEIKVSKGGDNILSMKLRVVSKFRAGQTIFKNFNIYHPKEVPQRIAREELAALCAALGIAEMSNVNDLQGLIVDAEVEKTEYNGKPTNEIKKFIETTGIKESSDFQAPVDERFNDEITF